MSPPGAATGAIGRRRFASVAIWSAFGAASRVFAQPRLPRVGLVSGGSPDTLRAFLHGLREAGYVPGESIVLERRATEGLADRYRPAVEAVLKTGVDVMVVSSTHGVVAAHALTRTVPIVVIDLETDPVASGFAASVARPGGNVTGVFLDLPEISGKLLQLLKDVTPRLRRVAVLRDAVIGQAQLEATERAARAAGVAIHTVAIGKAGDLDGALNAAAQDRAQALIVLSAPLTTIHQARIDELALRHRLPSVTMFPLREPGNGLMSYGPDLDDMFKRSASYVSRILKGARVGDLPIERPSKFELAVNLKTAKALGLTLPTPLLLRADRVIGQ